MEKCKAGRGQGGVWGRARGVCRKDEAATGGTVGLEQGVQGGGRHRALTQENSPHGMTGCKQRVGGLWGWWVAAGAAAGRRTGGQAWGGWVGH